MQCILSVFGTLFRIGLRWEEDVRFPFTCEKWWTERELNDRGPISEFATQTRSRSSSFFLIYERKACTKIHFDSDEQNSSVWKAIFPGKQETEKRKKNDKQIIISKHECSKCISFHFFCTFILCCFAKMEMRNRQKLRFHWTKNVCRCYICRLIPSRRILSARPWQIIFS